MSIRHLEDRAVLRHVRDLEPRRRQGGERVGSGKDIVLETSRTRLWWLADRFLLPGWFPYSVAFSLGDLLIAFGTFGFFWSLGSPGESYPKLEGG